MFTQLCYSKVLGECTDRNWHSCFPSKYFKVVIAINLFHCCQWKLLHCVHLQEHSCYGSPLQVPVYQQMLSEIIISGEKQVIFKNSFTTFKVIFMMFQINLYNYSIFSKILEIIFIYIQVLTFVLLITQIDLKILLLCLV